MTQVAAQTKTVDGKPLAKEQFAYVGDANYTSTWHLPVDSDHVESALDLFGHEKHVPPAEKKATAKKIASAAKSHGIDKDKVSRFEQKYTSDDNHADSHDYTGGWIEIFKAGDYTGQGKAKISRGDLLRVVNDYDPDYHEAPECIGHPADNLPAYGWVDRLKLDGDVLMMKEKQVDPEFAAMRSDGKFKKRSAAFYRDADGNIAGLRHVAWLGAQPPAVKGLKNLNFNDGDRGFVEFEFAQEGTVAQEKTVKEQVAEFFAELFSGKKAGETQTFSENQVTTLVAKAIEAATKPMQATIDQLKTDLTTQSTKFSEREKALTQTEIGQRATSAIVKLKDTGRWVPAFDRQGMPLVFAELAKITTTVEFGEGDAKKQLTPLGILVEFIEGLPKIVPNGRTVNGGAPVAAKGKTGDPLTDGARALAAEKKISYGEALSQFAEEHPELTVPGNAHAGAV